MFIKGETRSGCETQMPTKMASSKDGQDQKTNILKAVERSCHKKCSCENSNNY